MLHCFQWRFFSSRTKIDKVFLAGKPSLAPPVCFSRVSALPSCKSYVFFELENKSGTVSSSKSRAASSKIMTEVPRFPTVQVASFVWTLRDSEKDASFPVLKWTNGPIFALVNILNLPHILVNGIILSSPGLCAINSLTIDGQPFSHLQQSFLECWNDSSICSWADIHQ